MDIRVLACSRTYLLAAGIRSLLEPLAGIRPVGVACDLDDLLAMLGSGPDVIVADPSMATSVLDSLRGHPARLLLLHDAPPGDDLRDLIANGLGGLLPRDADEQTFAKALHTLAAGELWLDRKTVAETLCGPDPSQRAVRLTQREEEVLCHLCAGLSNKQIARSLYISEQTVKSHCNRLYKKFGVPSRLKLVLCARLSPPAPLPPKA